MVIRTTRRLNSLFVVTDISPSMFAGFNRPSWERTTPSEARRSRYVWNKPRAFTRAFWGAAVVDRELGGWKLDDGMWDGRMDGLRV